MGIFGAVRERDAGPKVHLAEITPHREFSVQPYVPQMQGKVSWLRLSLP
jgi:hypothetical protein